MIGITTVLNATLIKWRGIQSFATFAISLSVAAAFCAVRGTTIHYLNVPSFIVTLAGMFLARGGASLLSPDSIGINYHVYTTISYSDISLPGGGRLTVIGLVMLAVIAVGTVLAHRTRFGSCVYALGGSETSVALMGVLVARTINLVYTLPSNHAGLAGIVFSLYTSAGYSLSALALNLMRLLRLLSVARCFRGVSALLRAPSSGSCCKTM